MPTDQYTLLKEKVVELENVRKATFNILDDLYVERKISDAERRATANILEDLYEERESLEEDRRATFNILDDLYAERKISDEEQRATGNILEDLDEEKIKDEALLLSIGDGMIATDAEGKIIRMNPVAESMLTLSAKDALGKKFFEAVPAEDGSGQLLAPEARPLFIALAGGKSTTTTTTTTISYYVRKDKTKFPVAITVTPVVLNNKVGGAIEIFRDITEEKKFEKTRTDFLTLASHQLRTPLSGTKWLIETMQRKVLGPITPRQKEYLDQIYQVNERMIKLVFDMLNVIQLESGAAMIKKETVSIADLYEGLTTMMESAAKNRGVVLRNSLKNHKAVVVEVDATMLQSILECFVSNAINYSQSGQEITLDVKEETSAIVFFVEDKGIGIPKKEQKGIFERFYRASNAKALKPEGTGLGLYIASMLAEKIGAEVLFESEENKGSTFYLRVPKKLAT